MDQNWCKGRAISKKIFIYTGSPQVKILQKVLGGYFFDSHCRNNKKGMVNVGK